MSIPFSQSLKNYLYFLRFYQHATVANKICYLFNAKSRGLFGLGTKIFFRPQDLKQTQPKPQ